MHVRPGCPGTCIIIEVQRFVQLAFSMANFFKSILCVKTGEVEVNNELLLKKSTIDGYPY